MNDRKRSTRELRVIVLALVAFVVGLVLALWLPGTNVPNVVGALCIGPGLFLLLSRSLFHRDPGGPPTEQQVAAERLARMRMRTVGASVMLMGIAQFIPDTQMRITILLCAAAVSTAGVFGVPSRLFASKGSPR